MSLALLRIAVIALLAGDATGTSETRRCLARRQRDIDDLSALQTPAARRSSGAPHGREAEDLQRASVDVHIVAVSGCRHRNIWEPELLFYSAQWVGQRGPITAIIHGCDPQREKHIRKRHATLGLPDQYKLHFLPKLNDDRSSSISKPYGFAKWFAEVGPEADVVACVDPDFLFVRPLTPFVNPELSAGYYHDPDLSTDVRHTERVQKGVVAAQRWRTITTHGPGNTSLWQPEPPFAEKLDGRFRGWTDREVLTWICSGSRSGQSGCTDITIDEVASYHDTGPPYMAHKDDWAEWLAQDWHDITERAHSPGIFETYFLDMFSWVFANIHKGRRQLVVRNLLVTQLEFKADWSGIVNAKADPCRDPMDLVFSEPNLPNFVHYTGAFSMWYKKNLSESVFERCDAAAPGDEAGLARLDPNWVPNWTRSDHDNGRGWSKNDFIVCAARRFLAAGVKRACKGQPAAALFETMSAGLTL